MAEKYGLFIDYTWCTACRSCVMACKVEHGWKAGEANGIVLFEDGPTMMANGKYEYNNLPVFTSQCDLCADRTAEGKLPTCVHHCQSACMKYGTVDELVELVKETPRSWLYVPEQSELPPRFPAWPRDVLKATPGCPGPKDSKEIPCVSDLQHR